MHTKAIMYVLNVLLQFMHVCGLCGIMYTLPTCQWDLLKTSGSFCHPWSSPWSWACEDVGAQKAVFSYVCKEPPKHTLCTHTSTHQIFTRTNTPANTCNPHMHVCARTHTHLPDPDIPAIIGPETICQVWINKIAFHDMFCVWAEKGWGVSTRVRALRISFLWVRGGQRLSSMSN